MSEGYSREVAILGDAFIKLVWNKKRSAFANGFFLLEKVLDELQRFQEMKRDGIMSDAEFSDATEVLNYVRDVGVVLIKEFNEEDQCVRRRLQRSRAGQIHHSS
jgi:hypothetical protein